MNFVPKIGDRLIWKRGNIGHGRGAHICHVLAVLADGKRAQLRVEGWAGTHWETIEGAPFELVEPNTPKAAETRLRELSPITGRIRSELDVACKPVRACPHSPRPETCVRVPFSGDNSYHILRGH